MLNDCSCEVAQKAAHTWLSARFELAQGLTPPMPMLTIQIADQHFVDYAIAHSHRIKFSEKKEQDIYSA